MTTEEVFYCARHPQVETVLRCNRCNTPICPRCLVQTPVGAKCPDCARVSRLPTMDVKPVFLLRGLGAAIVSGLVVGFAWSFITGGRGGLGFFIFFIAMGIGWAIGESVSVATNRKRAVALQACAVVGVIIAYVTHNVAAGFAPLPQGDLFGYLGAALAAVYAASRLK